MIARTTLLPGDPAWTDGRLICAAAVPTAATPPTDEPRKRLRLIFDIARLLIAWFLTDRKLASE
jgi:hypothetical protein